MSQRKKNEWVCTNERTVLQSPFVQLIERDCHSGDDETKRHKFYVFRSREWANIIPVTEDGKVVMVRQHRIGSDTQVLEVPGGVVDPSDKDIGLAAIRELAEETGYEPLPGARCVRLGGVYANPAMQDNRCHSWIVGPVKKVRDQKLDAGEMIEVVEVPIAEIPMMLSKGEIDHALMLSGFFFLMLQDESAREILGRSLNRFALR